MRSHQMLDELALRADIYGGVRIVFAVRLQGDCDRVISSATVYEMGKRLNAIVGDSAIRVDADDPRQIGALVPELRPPADLRQQVRDYLVCRQPSPLELAAKPLFGEVQSQYPGVVAIALHSAGVARDPVFSHPL